MTLCEKEWTACWNPEGMLPGELIQRLNARVPETRLAFETAPGYHPESASLPVYRLTPDLDFFGMAHHLLSVEEH